MEQRQRCTPWENVRSVGPPSQGLVFVKLGGSVITDKRRPNAVREDALSRLAAEIGAARAEGVVRKLIVGHGSGSFGHWAARSYGTRDGVRTPREWQGYARVAAAAGRLNRLVTDAFLDAGVPVLSLQPSASARCEDGALRFVDTRPIDAALEQGLVPLVYGDVALDAVRGGTIISTEDIFVFLAGQMEPARILLVGEVPGVIGLDGHVVPRITPSTVDHVRHALAGASGVDVTGGMIDKVMRMIDLIKGQPETLVHLVSGTVPGLLGEVLRDASMPVGTRITSG